MNDNLSLQNQFFNHIKDKISKAESLGESLSELLNISMDSAYRRLRGETDLTFSEIQILAKHYHLSVDELMNINTDSIVFHYNAFENNTFKPEVYLTKLRDDLKIISQFKESQLIYAAKDIPIFHLFLVSEISAFKLFFWQKTIFEDAALKDQKFSFDKGMTKTESLSKEILKLFLNIPTVDIWNDETINSTLKQIVFYNDSDLFESKEVAITLLDAFRKLIEHLKEQAETGLKSEIGLKAIGKNNSYKLYYNEIILSDNTILLESQNNKVVFLPFNAINFLKTNNATFTTETSVWLNNLIKKSTLISEVSEKQRNQFFNKQLDKIEELKSEL